ncbi:methylated-DNA--[protein]-cysteine S-methyltransferase [Ruegeria aquimaris]|uniref:Methylated-DNA--[protein]-cysteine S-methyltransferase n=1 Tax=Ruegeria aquimaris TaxID=2984333 RepID=A0ABT3AG93_9RHOB|nr:methylated-DNA--[protein]-cysteine S-methyltransferase [Ruegeria sp. XHP0148]MCV2887302.1 methylated-DNA--[protein]-cysteine S-methyltransferase [Ruegeria sp. XHP0148]
MTFVSCREDRHASGVDACATPQALRDSVAAMLSLATDAFPRQAGLRLARLDTPLGTMVAGCDDSRLHLLEFADRRILPEQVRRLYRACDGDLGFGHHPLTDRLERQLSEYFEGRRDRFGLPLALHGTLFTRDVWAALITLPAGTTISYGQLAKRMGRSQAVRAVARANGANQISIVIPCHRVTATDGALTGYGGGLWRKRWLIDHEAKFFPIQGAQA